MVNLSEISQIFIKSLHLAQAPVAVCFTDNVPAGVEAWVGHSPAGCRFWQEAGNRVFATSSSDHSLCAIGIYTHNLDMPEGAAKDLSDALKVFGELGYVREQDIPQIPVLKAKSNRVVYGPLAKIPMEPDVVLLFVRPDQALIVAEAAQQVERDVPPAMGRPACAVIPQAKNTGRSALSLGCCGARAYLDVLADNTALYAIPGPALEAYAERIAALAKANGILSTFHALRRRDVEAGGNPTVQDSLAALG